MGSIISSVELKLIQVENIYKESVANYMSDKIGPLTTADKKTLQKLLKKPYNYLNKGDIFEFGLNQLFISNKNRMLVMNNEELIIKYQSLISKYVYQYKSLDDYIDYIERGSIKKYDDILLKIESFHEQIEIETDNYITNEFIKKLSDEFFNFYRRMQVYKSFDKINKFVGYFDKLKENMRIRNEQYIRKELIRNDKLLSNIDNKSLDKQQRLAVVSNNDNSLVVAGAGSGKTLTVAGKVKYLVDVKHVNPKEILLISFTSKSAQEMNDRISERLGLDVDVKTFHKLGLDIIAEKRNVKPDIFENTQSIINEFFKKEIITDKNKVESLVTFLGYYLKVPKDVSLYENLGDHISDTSSFDNETLRSKYNSFRENSKIEMLKEQRITINKETVKSLEEVMIANFLFLNGVDYEYERKYEYETGTKEYRDYRPDFYLTKYNIYLEHFGLNRNMNAPHLSKIEAEKYIEGYRWKQELHKEHNTKLIETYSYYNSDGILLSKLEEILKENGVELQERDKYEIYKQLYIDQKDAYFEELIRLINTFISLLKSNKLNASDIDKFSHQSKNIKNVFQRNRSELFFNLAKAAYTYYSNYLIDNKFIDFNDMINDATDIIKNGEVKLDYKYIIIDEFQDTSMSRYNLIKAIRDKSKSKLLCVGDDWQSIYRFAGSDIQIFTNFKQFFGDVQILKIENTYRNPQQLIDIAGEFVMNNGSQIKKQLKAWSNSSGEPISIIGYDKDAVDGVKKAIDEVVLRTPDIKEIMLLGRNNFDIVFLEKYQEFEFFKNFKDNETIIKYSKYPNIKFRYLTVHRSKGLESEAVIIINVNDGNIGFPNKIADDAILKYVLTNKEEYRFGEERRLFYVALTRTRSFVYITTCHNHRSEFVDELIDEFGVPYHYLTNPNYTNEVVNCPRCKTGHLLKRESEFGYFVTCTHYPQCDYHSNHVEILKNPIICRECGDFLLDYKNYKTGHHFLRCANSPKCEHKEEYNK